MDELELRSALGRETGVDIDGYTFEFGPPIPGVIVFTAYESGVPHSNITGAYDGQFHFEFDDSSTLVLTSLGFGDEEVDPAVIAAAVGMLQDNPGTPFLTEDAIDLGGDPSVMAPPRSTSVDGRPAVEFWNKSSRQMPWRVTVVADADGTFRVVNGT